MREGRVVVLSDYVGGGPSAGGAGIVVLDSFRALRAAGVDARLLVGFGENPGVEEDRFLSLGGRDLREGGPVDFVRAIFNPDAAARLRAALEGCDPDRTVVILHQWTRFLSPAALRPLARFPVMVYMHDHFWACPNGAYYDFRLGEPCRRRPLGPACCAADCDRAGRAVKIGRLARGFARAGTAGRSRRLFLHLSDHAWRVVAPLLPGEPHAIVHNPLAVPATPPDPAPTPEHEVGFIGRIEPEKGADLLADAAASLGLSALFVGQGSLTDAVAARPGVEVRPWLPRWEIAAAMRRCRVIALPSRWDETWGLVVPEAMAAGVPVLVSARAGSAELVRRFGGGTVFDPGKVGDLAAALARMLAGPPATVRDWDGFGRFLSPEQHADHLVTLAAEHWGIALRPADRISAPRPAAPAPVPAGGPPPAR